MRSVIRTPDFPVAETKKGKYHGFLSDDVYHFHGIRYGRAQRFELPEKVGAFGGIKDAKAFGYVCPLMRSSGRQSITSVKHDPEMEFNPMADPFANFEMQHVYWPMDEDCLFLNVWTKHLPGAMEHKPVEGVPQEKNVKRPVMLWLHGGGFGAGSAVELPAYDGHNLASYGDVVVVSINHRLNCLGFLDLSAYGESFRYSGIAGMADIVLALRWVKENIEVFGGDPENVTVAGQSGGGGKAIALLQMPPADGLFKRLICQSCAPGGLNREVGNSVGEEKKRWQDLGMKTAELLGLTAETIDKIRSIPYEQLSDAAEEAGRILGYAEGMLLFEPSPVPGFYEGRYECAGFREETKDIALIAGTVLGEFNFMHYFGDKSSYSELEKRAMLEEQFGADTDAVLTEFKKVYPDMDILYALGIDSIFRPIALRYLNARNAFTDAPCFNYMMSFIIPYLGGVTPWHCSCLPYTFRNLEKEPAHCTGTRTYAEKLQDDVSRAWISFLESGNPSTSHLRWDPYTAGKPVRIEFAEETRMTDADDTELMRLLQKHMQSR